jgi:two-component system, OmpR family, alkaline phosphatase synthesis response regulator PhoP
MATILVVDDEPQIAEIAADYLRQAGFTVITAGRGDSALAIAQSARPALIVLDLRLPGMDGLDVARALRRDSGVPIIMLTARVEESDRLRGLEIGADDYMTKPFSPRELVARVKAVLRRSRVGTAAGDLVPLGECSLDLSRRQVFRSGAALDLTATEFQLLLTLARQPGRLFTRAALLDAVRAGESDAFERAIDAHVKNIRRKIERDPRHPRLILTVYGVGYKAVEK